MTLDRSRIGFEVDWDRVLRRTIIGLLVLLAAVNLIADVAKIAQVGHLGFVNAFNTRGSDWLLMSEASRVMVAGGDPYAGSTFMWTPLGAVAFYPFWYVGWHLWQFAHVAAALAMPSWRMRIIVLVAYPFWFDLELGNILVFILLAAAWALRGNRIAVGAFLVLTVLVPRPLMAPIAIWLLWKHPRARVPFVAMAMVAVIAAAALGVLGPFVARSLEAGSVMQHGYNFAPSRLLGAVWLIVAIPLAAWFSWKGRLGLASVFASPYWLPYYLLLGLVDVDRAAIGSMTAGAPYRRRER